MSLLPERAILDGARRAARSTETPLLLAVSGGLDSMTLLSVMAAVARDRIAAVATFDHGTGVSARRAVRHVERVSRALGLVVITGRLTEGDTRAGGLEARWREGRLRFLRATAARLGARIVTAHTQDDQIETVLMRVLRGSGARGLAGLASRSDILRPFLSVRRRALERYAESRGVSWVEDPSNASTVFLRNRIRREVLPALRRADPTIDDALLATARVAAEWREDVERFVDRSFTVRQPVAGTVVVATAELADYDLDSLAVLWGALAGRAGLALDRRGTQRCATFTMRKPSRGSIPLSGGWSVEANPGTLVLRRTRSDPVGESFLPVNGVLEWGSFRFATVGTSVDDGGWSASIPLRGNARVRRWRAGDRLAPSMGQRPRRVKRYLSEAGVRGSDRDGWPVVVVEDEVVWIPGVRRSNAASVQSDGLVRHFICERSDG
jgi:tRNA(Ile)-lysidine synthase